MDTWVVSLLLINKNSFHLESNIPCRSSLRSSFCRDRRDRGSGRVGSDVLWILRLAPGHLKRHLQSVSREPAALESELRSLSRVHMSVCCGCVSLRGPGPYGIMSSSSGKAQPLPSKGRKKCESYVMLFFHRSFSTCHIFICNL